MFIVLEGGEGTGKSTQATLLQQYLESKGRKVHTTREPGGCESAEKIRALVLNNHVLPRTQALLFTAARYEHIQAIINPKIKEGIDIICDRFFLSSLVYQGIVLGVEEALLYALHKEINDNIMPDITIILDTPASVSLNRVHERHKENKDTKNIFDDKEIHFHENIRKGFLDWASQQKNNTYIVDGENSIQGVQEKIRTIIDKRL